MTLPREHRSHDGEERTPVAPHSAADSETVALLAAGAGVVVRGKLLHLTDYISGR